MHRHVAMRACFGDEGLRVDREGRYFCVVRERGGDFVADAGADVGLRTHERGVAGSDAIDRAGWVEVRPDTSAVEGGDVLCSEEKGGEGGELHQFS